MYDVTTSGARTRRFQRRLSLALLAAVTLTAAFATDVRLLIAVRGALLGSIITLVLPAVILLRSEAHAADESPGWARARLFAKGLVFYGAASSVLGTAACVLQG